MSRWGISGGPLPSGLPYADAIQTAFEEANLSPMFGYAEGSEESIKLEVSGYLVEAYGAGTTAANVVSTSGGYGLFQLTPSASGIALPENWQDPLVNARFAVEHWFNAAAQGGFPYWTAAPFDFEGTTLIKCVAASFNAGLGGAMRGHEEGDVDTYTENGNYGQRVVDAYLKLITGKVPWA